MARTHFACVAVERVDAKTSQRVADGNSSGDRSRDRCAVHGFIGESPCGVRSRREAVSSVPDCDCSRHASRTIDVLLSAMPGVTVCRSKTSVALAGLSVNVVSGRRACEVFAVALPAVRLIGINDFGRGVDG